MELKRGVLTKDIFMFIIHRITIQGYVRDSLCFVHFSSLLFPWKGDTSHERGVLTEPWSSSF